MQPYLDLVQSGIACSHGFVDAVARQAAVERVLDAFGDVTIERIPLPLDPASYTLVVYEELSGQPLEVRLDTADGDYYNIVARVQRRPRGITPAAACADNPHRVALALPPGVARADSFDPATEAWVLVSTLTRDDSLAVLLALGFTRLAG